MDTTITEDFVQISQRIDRDMYNRFLREVIIGKTTLTQWVRDKIQEELDNV